MTSIMLVQTDCIVMAILGKGGELPLNFLVFFSNIWHAKMYWKHPVYTMFWEKKKNPNIALNCVLHYQKFKIFPRRTNGLLFLTKSKIIIWPDLYLSFPLNNTLLINPDWDHSYRLHQYNNCFLTSTLFPLKKIWIHLCRS